MTWLHSCGKFPKTFQGEEGAKGRKCVHTLNATMEVPQKKKGDMSSSNAASWSIAVWSMSAPHMSKLFLGQTEHKP